ncbi:MAG: restriction endonuclease subunit R [Dehalococcoides mccartyi]|uniref:type I restriction endonuclease subunit R n=1 Tax=Dehalococcoides mccartyi TaxID=61435 RepID=UPI00242A45F0|nr:HsdR family type I site-specific deoxyribonuclease [Dehalococcoides mccartyi]MCF7635006.1 restriction endonuclease subunit R [Dehalococcoides mccartyi]
MSEVGDIEKRTQDRVVQLFSKQLGYTYLGNWETRPNNSNIEEPILRKYLKEKRGYSDILINKALYELTVASKDLSDGLYVSNQKVYSLLRYGVKVKAEAGDNFETVQLIDWKHPLKNEFAIAEEVTISGQHDKRPDIVICVNGIALGVLELKRSIISIGDGIRQNIVNQQKEFIQSFFSTIQWVFAGNDTQGLRYGTIGTPEKYFLQWKEEGDVENLLDKYLLKLCEKQRFLEIIYDFTLFDAGIKKLCRTHQYFGVKAAQEHVKRREGGVIWHTQGSGKSLVMVWLAKWILENNPHARVVIVTDRDELDKQIERVFKDAGEQMVRTTSGKDLMEQLGKAKPRMLCSLVHKFGRKEVDNFNEFIKELEDSPAQTVGELFIFVDECHRTQSGKLHKVMKALLKTAVFIGFTGTPLLKQDKQTSLEVFGKYIHTYKFNEGVEDGVVLDLVYEARDIDQKLTSTQKIDEWFEAKTKGLNDFQKSELKRQWGTMQKVLSSRSRLEKVVSDIIFDFNVKPRLSSGLGNAILVASSIYEACRYFELFQKTELKDKCAIVTSYNPVTKDITTEDTGAGTETEREFIYNLYKSLLGNKSTEKYEDEAKAKFIKEPANMKLLVVVDKLLVGFDAPPCSYLYIDKSMQDHGLFQAICRVNRLDSEDKQFGYIVDYKDLFKKVENAVAVYTSELDYDTFGQEEVDVLLKDRLEKGKERLDKALEEIALLCEPVEPPKDQMAYIRYFCGNPENDDDLKSTETRRTFLYKDTVALIRAYANIAAELEEAGYSQTEIAEIKKKVDFYLNLREEIKNASGETLDMKTYEADMRHLIDTYIQAEVPRTISPFADMSLLDIIVNSGIAAAITSLPPGIKNNKEAVAEAIINNVRKKIIKEHLIDPAYFEEMSKLLDEIIKERKANAISYEEYLRKIADLSKKVTQTTRDDLPAGIQTPAQRALYNNTGKNEALAIKLDAAVKKVKKADWRGNTPKENEIKQALNEILKDQAEVERLFAIIKQQGEY